MRRRFGPPVRLEVEEHDRPARARAARPRARHRGAGGRAPSRAAGPHRPDGRRRPSTARSCDYPAFVPRTAPATWPRSRRADEPRHPRRHPQARRPAAPPLRLVLDQRAGASSSRRPPTRRSSPSSRRSTARAVTPRSSTPSSTRPRPASRSLVARRDQGALRRAGQHQLGPQARAGRLPRRLRARRPEDPLQAVAGRARRRATGSAATPTSAPATTTRKTARIYEDLGLLTADPLVGEDVATCSTRCPATR